MQKTKLYNCEKPQKYSRETRVYEVLQVGQKAHTTQGNEDKVGYDLRSEAGD